MTMSMYKSICVTNRHLVKGDYFEQIRRVAKSRCDAIILREKDMTEEDYHMLAQQILTITKEYPIPCILHTFTETALDLHVSAIHLPLADLLSLPAKKLTHFSTIGVSVHSVPEAITAFHAGATYLTAGHIFATDCKKGVPPRGLDFLQSVCKAVPIPVYAIGGITTENTNDCILAGAKGVCKMSSYMML